MAQAAGWWSQDAPATAAPAGNENPDVFSAPGIDIKYVAAPGATYGKTATENAKPFSAIVVHHTGSDSLDSALSTLKGDPNRGGASFGYHFYIDKDGSVVQGVPLSARTNHVKGAFGPLRTGGDIGNENAVGVSFVGASSDNLTPAQLDAGKRLSAALMQKYGIDPTKVVGHGEIQKDRQSGEGMPLVRLVRDTQGNVKVAQEPMPTDVSSRSKTSPDWWSSDPETVAKKDIGIAKSVGLGAAQGATFNFGDEIRGVQNAAGLPNWVPGGVDAMVGLAKLGYEYLSGGDEAAKKYREGRDDFRGMVKTAEEQHPVATTVGNVGGALLTAPIGGAAAQGAGLAARTGRAIVTGGAIGGLSGAGEGEGIEDRATRALTGGLIGGGVGGVAAPIVGGAVSAVSSVARPVVNMVRGALSSENEAARRVVGAISADMRSDPNALTRLTSQEFVDNVSGGGPAKIMDLGGPLTRRLADSAAITSADGGATINQTINNRFEGQSQRFVDWFNDQFHYPNAIAQQQAIETTAKGVNKVSYDAARKAGAGGILDQELYELSQAPVMQSAIKGAIETAQNKSAGGAINPAAVTRWINNDRPTLEFWDLVKRQVDQDINVAKRAGKTEDVKTLTEVKSQLVKKLDDATIDPATGKSLYAQARQNAASFFGAENAVEAGQNFVTENLGNKQARAQLAKMTPQERQLFQDGFVSRYIDILKNTADRRSVLNKIGNSDEAREKLEIALGRQKSEQLETMLRVEGIMDMARSAVQGNSWTAKRLYDLGLAGGTSIGGVGTYNMDPQQVAYGALVAAVASGGKHIDRRVAMRVAEMLVSNDPKILQRGLQIASNNSRFLEGLRSIDRKIAAVGGNEAPKTGVIPALQSPVAARADQEQPSVPGPPAQ
jgi:hypothetical protein